MKRNIDVQWGLRRAKKNSLLIVEPGANQLQIDIDGKRALHDYGLQFNILRKGGLTRGWKESIKPSKSGGNRFHVTITMPRRIDNVRRIALQALLCSDLKREAFNLCRVINGNKYPIVFFEKEK